MKKLFTLISLLLTFNAFAQPGCPACPEEIFVRDSINCNFGELHFHQGSTGTSTYSNSDSTLIRACQNSIMQYSLMPLSSNGMICNYPNFTVDTIIVQGGILLSHTNTLFNIQWGNTTTGTVQIQFHVPGSLAGGNDCNGIITIHYNLLPNPIAAFTAAPNPACFNSPTNITFNSTASVGAVSYFWNFGDGFTSVAANPVHAYTSAGTYTVCLTVSNSASGAGTTPNGSCPSCVGTVCHTVVIDNLPGPTINCIATVCAGTTETYCSNDVCATYNWVITGGVITSANPSTSQCITVQWGSGNPQGNIHLSIPCAGFCPNGSDFTVPIIPTSTTIAGSSVVCVGSTNSYSLPAFPGSTYNWSITGGQFISGNNTNTTQITTTWYNLGTYTITCNYYDTALNCGGTGTIVVNVLPEMKITGPAKRCVGQNGTYNSHIVSPLTNVNSTWTVTPAGATVTAGNGTPNAIINFSAPGTYVVTATPVSGGVVCGAASYSVIVYPSPVISAINGRDSICPGGTNVYSATSNMPGLFTWSITGGTGVNLGSNNDSIQITWNASGTYSISVSESSYANNCPGLPFTKTVYAYPTPNITGNTNVCADNIETYTITNIGSGFNWYVSPAQFGTVISAPGANPVQIKWHGNNNPGFSNTVYLHYGICNNDSVAITINDPVAPTITRSGNLCPGVTLTSSGTGTFSWSHAEAPPVFSNTNTLSGLNYPGHYTVQLITAAGCTVSATYNVANVGRPVASIYANGPLIYCNPNLPNMTLFAVSGGGYTYQWFKGNLLVGTGSSLAVNNTLVPGLGTYDFTCVVTLNGCTDTSNHIYVQVITCSGGNGQGVGCPGAIAITNISGCNPFTITAAVTNGVYIVPGSMSITHLEDNYIVSGNTTRTYTSIGIKSIKICVNVKLADSSVCSVCKDTFVNVKVAARFLKNVNCSVISLTDLSTVATPATISSYNWTVTPAVGASFNNNAAPSPTLTVTQSGTYIISQTVTSSPPNPCSASFMDTVTVVIPDADFNVSNSCVGTTVNLNNLFPAVTNFWNFGDATSSNTSPTLHAYATVNTFNIVHIVTDAFGCKDTVSKPINISATPVCTISYSGPTSFCSGDSLKLNACAGYTAYQWLNNGVAISGATSQIYYATQTGNYSFTANNPLGCNVSSDTVVITVNQSPSTSMSFTGQKCFGSLYGVSAPSCTGCFYIWEVDGSNVQSGLGNQYSQTVGTAPFTLGSHLIKVTIFGSNGCYSVDSVTVVFNPLPTVSIAVSGNPPQLCSNNLYTFIATTNASSPGWAWTFSGFNNILSTTFSLTASTAGTYVVQVTDGVTGCSNTASQSIDPSPDLTLFPAGCDTLCNNTSLFLPLASFNGNVAGYTITWYDNAPPYNNVVGSGVSINLNTLLLGAHNLSVIVVGPNGCVDTSNVYYIYIVPSTSSNNTVSACGTYTWLVNGVTYTSSGTYTSSTINASGCPQYDTLNLTITTGTSSTTTISACDTYTWVVNGVTYTLSGTYTYSTVNPATGCITTYTLILTIKKSTESSLSVTACGSYTWAANGLTYTTSGTYTFTGLNPAGCPHLYILMLSITTNTSTVSTINTCANNYTWSVNNVTYTLSGTYTYTTLSGNGCIKTDSLILTLNTGTSNTTNITACNYYTWPVNNTTYTMSGMYTYTYLDPIGCVHTENLILVINHSVDSILNITACGSYTWAGNGITYTASGTYTYTTMTNGCVNYFILNLTISNGTSSTTTASACGSYTWALNGVTYTLSGTYTYTFTDVTGCIHITTLILTILPNTTSTQTVIACDQYTWPVNGVTYTASGTYTYTSLNANGCIHTSTLILNLNYTNVTTYYITACGFYTWVVNGVTYTASGSYYVITTDSSGCAHVYVMCLIILPNTFSTLTASACNNYTWSANGMTYTASGVYTHTSLNTDNCLHTSTLILTILHSTSSSVNITACGSYTWPANGITYTASGAYTFTSLNSEGCIHTTTLNLTINPGTSSTQTITACDSYTWYVNGTTYTASGTYTYTSVNSNGCVHTYTLALTINHTTITTVYVTACNSYTWPVDGMTYTASCVYTYYSVNAQGCPHLFILCLTIYPNTSSSVNVTACNSYTWTNGVTYTASGVYTYTSLNANACLHTSTLNLIINHTTTSSVNVTACGSYIWMLNGVTYTSSGTYTYTNINSQGCPHITTLNLIINPNSASTQNVIACDSYTWSANNVTYTSSGIYTYTYLNTTGCVHTATLNLIINHTSTSSTYFTACGSYTWPVNGVTYTASGMYTSVSINSQGCPHFSILILTIHQNSTSTTNVTACNSYTWTNGVTYTASGVYTYTSINAGGCINTATLNLTINTSTSSTVTATACNSYTWPLNGVTYTASGTYTYTYTGTQGCPHTATLVLIINHSTSYHDTVITCNYYTWPINGVMYTMSGVYSVTSINSSGCVHTNTLALTINSTTITSHCDTICGGPYVWNVNGMSYTVSGVYTYTVIGANGCPHIYILCLTINQGSSSTTNVSACETYTWPANGITYTSSGTYTYTSLNSSGCPHISTLVLFIGHSTVSNSFYTTCGSYTWPVNGVTYTASGVYMHTVAPTATELCPHIYVLNLTIHENTNSTVSVNACGSYLWNQNGVTYTTSGIYIHTSLNSTGCLHTATLILTLGTNTITSSNCDSACNSYTWVVNGMTYTTSGVYTYITTGSNGCPHIYILCITIKHSSSSTSNVIATNTYTWNANGVSYTSSGTYTATLTNTQNCDSVLTLNLTVNHTPSLSMKAMLSGPYQSATGLMTDSLRTLSLIPLTEPYTSAPYYKQAIGGGGGETTTTTVLSVSGNNAIVDWIHIEVRSSANNNLILANKNALIQRDGDIVSAADGVSPVQFTGLPTGNYFVSIKHRNHLGVMTASFVNLTSNTLIDFTTTSLYTVSSITTNTPGVNITGINLLWSGEDNVNKNVKYNGGTNDKDPILYSVGLGTPNNTVYGYRAEDLNMDGKVKYNNADNDRNVILINVGSATPNKILSQHTPN